MGLLKRNLTIFTPNLTFKNVAVLINRRKIAFQIFHQSWGLTICRFLENETANPEMEDTIVISVQKYL